ncbi:energy-coupling factor transporter transmembrane protein EcfT [Nesterenkonia sp. E16_7]|uniref:CbiQ family ECF transporter T component n=1 Tax=unclassified Nesterenkonia TaxID=2629769 RepID=UPI001A911198|nr:energy-coupling factor transporter transmembrane protein EcfT [Nesterenkonia sp. E16_10]MBO0597326.1 energy-coupling factor transporter transmembrane protein EcfT [Nesterenkonia sp. E16_7]
MIPLYQPGTSYLHRLPVGAKFLGIFLAALIASIFRENLAVLLGVWALTLTGFLLSGVGLRGLLAQLWRLKWLALVLIIPQLIFLTPAETGFNVARVLAVVLMAALFTLTTATSDILSSFERLLRPVDPLLLRLGLSAERISLALSLTIRSVPLILSFYAEIREAQRARGMRPTPRATVLPLLVMSLRHAEETAEALAARGVR